MTTIENWTFGKGVKAAYTSSKYINSRGNTLILQVNGEPVAGLVLEIKGRADIEDGAFVTLGCVDCADLTAVTDGKIEAVGIYKYDISGITEIEAVVTSVTGEIKIFGKIVSGGLGI